MNIFLRVLLSIYSFFLMILSAFVMVVTIKSNYFYLIMDYFSNSVLTHRSSSAVAFSIALVFFILSLVFLLSGIKVNKDKKAVSKHTNIGDIKISLGTIENIALAASRKISGVKETRANVYKRDDTVSVTINTVVLNDVNIPELSAAMQDMVKKAVENISGIGVNEVTVIVENVYSGTPAKSRVE